MKRVCSFLCCSYCHVACLNVFWRYTCRGTKLEINTSCVISLWFECRIMTYCCFNWQHFGKVMSKFGRGSEVQVRLFIAKKMHKKKHKKIFIAVEWWPVQAVWMDAVVTQKHNKWIIRTSLTSSEYNRKHDEPSKFLEEDLRHVAQSPVEVLGSSSGNGKSPSP